MALYPIKLPRRINSEEETISDFGKLTRPKRVRFREPERSPVSDNISIRNIYIPERSQFLRDWPHPPHIHISSDDIDPFPLFNPTTARYFDRSGDTLVCVNGPTDDNTSGNVPTNSECGAGDVCSWSEKRFAYSLKGAIKDYFFAFKPLNAQEEQENLELADHVNRQILHTIARNDNKTGKPSVEKSMSSEVNGWNEDSRSPEYWQHRMREVEYFVNNDLWSVDPIGDWSYLNKHKVPRDFLRRLRRYFHIRPLEYLNDTGSYRMFHVVNQYCDLEKLAKNEQKAALHKARKMELDYLAMIWLSIWDPRLEANVWQLQEMAMTDWFFSRTGWSNAIGVRELLTQNEVYAMDSLWDHRAKQREKENEDDAQEAEELEDWVRSGVSDAVSSRFSESGIVHH